MDPKTLIAEAIISSDTDKATNAGAVINAFGDTVESLFNAVVNMNRVIAIAPKPCANSDIFIFEKTTIGIKSCVIAAATRFIASAAIIILGPISDIACNPLTIIPIATANANKPLANSVGDIIDNILTTPDISNIAVATAIIAAAVTIIFKPCNGFRLADIEVIPLVSILKDIANAVKDITMSATLIVDNTTNATESIPNAIAISKRVAAFTAPVKAPRLSPSLSKTLNAPLIESATPLIELPNPFIYLETPLSFAVIKANNARIPKFA